MSSVSFSMERPVSELLVDLHVLVIPNELWKERQNLAYGTALDEAISVGFIRVVPDLPLAVLRDEIDGQLGDSLLPKDYKFLRFIGRCFAQVRRKQENQLRVKHFLPPHSLHPDLFVVEAGGSQAITPLSSTSQISMYPRSGNAAKAAQTSDAGHEARSVSPQRNQGFPLIHGQQRNKSTTNHRSTQTDDKAPPWSASSTSPENTSLYMTNKAASDDRGRERHESAVRIQAAFRGYKDRRRFHLMKADRERRQQEHVERLRRETEHYKRQKATQTSRDEAATVEDLTAELEFVREGRRELERKRDDAIRKAKQLQARINLLRNQARDSWKKRYYDEKKKTVPLETQCSRLESDVETMHKKMLARLEADREVSTARSDYFMPTSDRNLNRVQATKLRHETEELKRKVDNSKIKLTTEMKLRRQAESELKALRAELTQKRINLSLHRSQQIVDSSQEFLAGTPSLRA